MDNLPSTSTSSEPTIEEEHNLDTLTNEICHFHLFEYLDLDDVCMLRLVNKKLYSIVKDYRVIELVFSKSYSCDYFDLPNGYNNCYKRYWFSTTNSTRLRSQFDHSQSKVLVNPSDTFLNLKYLSVKTSEFRPFSIKLADLNKFVMLKFLMIEITDLSSNCLLKLPDLLGVSIWFDHLEKTDSLLIDTPYLQSLSIFCFSNYNNLEVDFLGNQIKISHPLSVEYLKLDRFSKNASMFSNLECLELNWTDRLKIDDLSTFNNLRTLRVSFDQLASIVYELEDLFLLKQDDLQMICGGVRIEEADELNQIATLQFDQLKFLMQNYSNLEDNLLFFNGAMYNDLKSYVTGDLPARFFDKFTNIQSLEVGRIDNEGQLIEFVQGCCNLDFLNIDSSSLSQNFFDQLSTTILLSNLKIYRHTIDLDFKFIMKMPYLKRLDTDQDVLTDENLNLNNLKHLKIFKFQINDEEIKLFKEKKDRYKIIDCQSLDLADKEYFCFEELIKWFNYLENAHLRFKKIKLS